MHGAPAFWKPAALAALVLVPLAYWPLGTLLWRALTPDSAAPGAWSGAWSGAAFGAVWTDQALRAHVQRAAALTLAVTTIAVVCGALLGGLWARSRSPLVSGARAIMLLPLLVPIAALGVVVRVLFDTGGWGAALLRTLDLPALPVAHSTELAIAVGALAGTGVVAALVAAAWERVQPGVTDAARLLGAGPWRRFRLSAGYLVLPALLGGGALAAAIGWSGVAAAWLFDGTRTDTIEVLLYERASAAPTLPYLAAIALLHSAVVALLLALAYVATRGVRETAARRPPRAPGSRRAAAGTVAVCMIGVLLATAVAATGAAAQAGALAALRADVVRTALLSSTLIALDAAALAAVAALATVSALRRARRGWSRLATSALLLPAAITPLTLALAAVAATDAVSALRATTWAVLAVHAMVGYPFALWGALRRTDTNAHDALRLTARSRPRGWTALTAGPGLRTFVASASLAATASLGEFAATSLVRSPALLTAPLLITDRWTPGPADAAWLATGLALLWIGLGTALLGLRLRAPSRTGV